MNGKRYPVTPDGRYFVVRGRLWRCANPDLPEPERQALVASLMRARRQLRDASGSMRLAAKAEIQRTKMALGERGPVWWDDGAPDYNRCLAKNTPYALWWKHLDGQGAGGPPSRR
ncbi:hypothetical protein [Roseateles sp.]|uniref:hypothetical protein n=1 Tax=Roseateles sp. TaxID=1971397 RepID=UPI0031CDE936